MKIFLVVSTCCTLLAAACSFCPNDSKILIGNYSFNRNDFFGIKDSIFIYSNGTYKHKFLTNKGQTFEANGKWSYSSTDCEVLFEDFIFFNNQGSDGLPAGNWYSRIKIENGETKLMYSSEDNIFFSKK